MKSSFVACVVVAACFVSLAARAQTDVGGFGVADTPAQTGVVGSGIARLSRPPDLMRIQIGVCALGRGMPDALAKLNKRRDAALKFCAAENASKDSIYAGSPKIVTPPQFNQAMQQARPKKRAGTKPGQEADSDEAAAQVMLFAGVTADWPVKGASLEEKMTAGAALQEKIQREAGKFKQDDPLSLEEEELIEEASGPHAAKLEVKPGIGEAVAQFVAIVRPADYDKAAARAFAEAKSRAEQLCRAAGRSLGELRGLSGVDSDDSGSYYSPGMFATSGGGGAFDVADKPNQLTDEDLFHGRPGEVTGTKPEKLTLAITVQATFALGK